MSFYPENPLLGQKIQTEVEGKTADKGYIAHVQFSEAEAVAAAVDAVSAAITCSADSLVTITDGLVNPPCARNITATVAATTTGNIKAVKVKVYGTNINDEEITEELPAFTADTAGTVTGNKAFKTVTKVEIPAMDGATVTVTIGYGSKLGLPYKILHKILLAAFLDNTLEGTVATLSVSGTAIESNTIALNSALNGKVVDVYLVV